MQLPLLSAPNTLTFPCTPPPQKNKNPACAPTVRTIRARRALQQYAQAGLPLERITVSSDAFGSLPTYDGAGRLLRYSVADGKALLRFLRNMYFQVGGGHKSRGGLCVV